MDKDLEEFVSHVKAFPMSMFLSQNSIKTANPVTHAIKPT